MVLSKSVYPDFADDSYAVRSLPTVLKSYYITGLRYRGEKQGDYVRSLWLDALDLIGLYENIDLDPADRAKLYIQKVKFLVKLAELSPEPEQYGGYSADILKTIDEYMANFPDDSATVLAMQLEYGKLSEPLDGWNYTLSAGGSFNGMVMRPGILIDFSLSNATALERFLVLEWSLGYKHDSFAFKTFNFNSAKSNEDRYVEWTEDFSADISLMSGSKYFFNQTWNLGLSATLAEDPGDLSYGGDLSWDLAWSYPNLRRFTLDNTAAVKFFPDYINAGNQINNIQASTNPAYVFVFSPNNSLELGYQLEYRYYLNAHYDTVSGGTDPGSRSYLTNSAQVALDLSPSKPLKLGLTYDLSCLKSFNYDVLVTGLPADQFVEGYFDNISNELGADIGISQGIYDGKLSLGVGLRSFLNYPAWDAAKNFTGELRRDFTVDDKLANSFLLIDSQTSGKISVFADALLQYSNSNHTYEVSYVTNYTNMQIMLGLEWKD